MKGHYSELFKGLILLSIGVLLLFMSCEKDKDLLASLKGNSGVSYNESLAKWSLLKDQNGNSYSYAITFTSWTGYGSVTELLVNDGKVVGRVYEEFNTNEETGERDVIEYYTETLADLGSHKKGAAVVTIDELYDSCAKDYLSVDEQQNTIYFDTAENGVMISCGFVPDGCQDDCYTGITINSFKWLD